MAGAVTIIIVQMLPVKPVLNFIMEVREVLVLLVLLDFVLSLAAHIIVRVVLHIIKANVRDQRGVKDRNVHQRYARFTVHVV